MDLYIVRHAIAVERSPELPDVDRPLTDDGREKFQREVQAMERLGIELDTVFHSPWLRAVQTAQELEPLLTHGGGLVETAHLADDPAQPLLAQIREDSTGERVAVVGHEPWMSELMAWLMYGRSDLSGAIAFKKGGVAWLRGDLRPGSMTLCSFFAPKHLRRAGR